MQKKIIITIFTLLILFSISINASDKDLYVWFETNNQTLATDYIANANSWLPVGKPVVSSVPSSVESFTQQFVDAGIPVISGFKTFHILDGKPFHDSASWVEIARLARSVSAITDGRPVILENEAALEALLEDSVIFIEYDSLLAVISAQEWPEIWFWSAPGGRAVTTQEMTSDVAKAIINGITNASLIEANSAGFNTSYRDVYAIANLARTLEIDSTPISIVYLDDSDDLFYFWDLPTTNMAIDSAIGERVIVYPGFGDIGKSDIVIQSLAADIETNINDQNYESKIKLSPNPFNPYTTIEYSLYANSKVTLNIYNSRGNLVSSLINNKNKNAGTHSIIFNAKNLSSGFYFSRLITENYTVTGKMLFVK